MVDGNIGSKAQFKSRRRAIVLLSKSKLRWSYRRLGNPRISPHLHALD